MSTPGTVYLVGAGPGDPDLLTVKAQRLLRQCDALVYDSLVPREVLDLVSEDAEQHFVGKRRGHHSVPQPSTNAVLVELAQRCRCVVRLKGGDPFLFGRGGEEAAHLARHGVPVEVVPGVTAGIAAPAYVGIPVTHRRAGSSVTFVTGHEEIDKRRPGVDWRGLARCSDGLVIYMGLHNLQRICDELIAGRARADTFKRESASQPQPARERRPRPVDSPPRRSPRSTVKQSPRPRPAPPARPTVPPAAAGPGRCPAAPPPPAWPHPGRRR